MIEVHVLASSSAGCCYRVTDGSTPLLVEAGIPIRRIREGVRFQMSSLAGCLVSHEHGDHARAVRDLLRAGVDVYASSGTLRALGVELDHRARHLAPRRQVRIGTWTVLPFEAVHDAAEPFGFLLASGDEKLLYLTDSAYCRYRFAGLTVLMIECNYSAEILRRNVAAGRIDVARRNRVLRNHMGLERVLELLRANDLARVREIHLLHLSDENSDEAAFKAAVERATGKPVYVSWRGW